MLDASLDPAGLGVAADVADAWHATDEQSRKLAHWDVNIEHVERLARFVGLVPAGLAWLDWGCGGGALMSTAEHRLATSMIAVDVSTATLDALSTPHVPLIKVYPHDVACLLPGTVDVLCSFAAFQHFPDPAYGLRVLQQMRRLARPGALGFVQVRYFEPGDNHDPQLYAQQPYAQRMVRSCAYQIGQFWGALADAGFTPINAELEPLRHYAWFRFAG